MRAMDNPKITIELTDRENFSILCIANAPNLQVAIHMLEQALEETKHAFLVVRQKREAGEIMRSLQDAHLVNQLTKGAKQ